MHRRDHVRPRRQALRHNGQKHDGQEQKGAVRRLSCHVHENVGRESNEDAPRSIANTETRHLERLHFLHRHLPALLLEQLDSDAAHSRELHRFERVLVLLLGIVPKRACHGADVVDQQQARAAQQPNDGEQEQKVRVTEKSEARDVQRRLVDLVMPSRILLLRLSHMILRLVHVLDPCNDSRACLGRRAAHLALRRHGARRLLCNRVLGQVHGLRRHNLNQRHACKEAGETAESQQVEVPRHIIGKEGVRQRRVHKRTQAKRRKHERHRRRTLLLVPAARLHVDGGVVAC